jgi:transcription antitermination factor NusG
MQRSDSEGFHHLNAGRVLQRGTVISVIAGVFEGLEGIFDREICSERVVVLLNLLGVNTPVRIESNHIVPVVS